MQAQSRFNDYKYASIQTMTPGELIILLYEEAGISVNRAVFEIGRKNPAGAHHDIVKAENIVAYLMESLDMRYPISEQLMKTYEAIHRQLIDANVRKDPELLKRVCRMLSELKDAWQQAELSLRTRQAMGG
jgi:flagellar protein FliS